MKGLVAVVTHTTRPIRTKVNNLIFWYVIVEYETEAGTTGETRLSYPTFEECLEVDIGYEMVV